jgi:hypothetical protein
MLVGLIGLAIQNDALRYSLFPLEKVMCPFKKHIVKSIGND